MNYEEWVVKTPHPTYCNYWAINIDWGVPTASQVYLGSFRDEEEADHEADRSVRYIDHAYPTFDIHSEPVCWQEAIDDGADDEEEAREAYDEYLKVAIAPDAPGMDKWMAEKQAEHFGTDAGVGDPPEGNR